MSQSIINQELTVIESTLRTIAERLLRLEHFGFSTQKAKAVLREEAARISAVADRVSIK